jgi:Ciliary BBSome complex subunit 2, C-terminal
LKDLCGFLGISAMESQIDFPVQLEAFSGTLQRLSELNALRSRLTGDLAEATGRLKSNLVRAEDARVRGDIKGVRKHYTELRGLAGELSREYTTRAGVHSALTEELKAVNVMIQRAAALRGSSSSCACDAP